MQDTHCRCRSAADVCRRQRARIDILAMPQLEHEQLPQPQCVVPPACQMFMDEPVDETRLEVAPLARPRRAQNIGKHVGQSTTEPDAKRDTESLLLPIDDL